MEQSLAMQRDATKGMLEVYDMSGLGPSHVAPTGLAMLSRVLSIGQKHYPENLSRCFIINAPILFRASWEAIAVIFSSTTLGKVVTKSDDGGDELLEAVGNKERLGELLALKPEAQTWSNWLGISS